MSAVRFRIELNKGREGMPIDKLAAVVKQTGAFLLSLSADMGLELDEGDWATGNFSNGSVDFDCICRRVLPDAAARRTRRALALVIAGEEEADDAETRALIPMISPRTRREYRRIAKPIARDDVIRLGLYGADAAIPELWCELHHEARDDQENDDGAVPPSRTVFGEIQGSVHAFFKEAPTPYLRVRELATRNLVNCYFPSEMYQAAVEVLAERDAVIFVEGWVKENPDTGLAEAVEVTDFRPAPEFDEQQYHTMLGSMPDYTGELSTEVFVAGVRRER